MPVTKSRNQAAIRVISRDRPPGLPRAPHLAIAQKLKREPTIAVGGIAIKEHLEISLSPMQVRMTHTLYSQLMQFFFNSQQATEHAGKLAVRRSSILMRVSE